MKLISIFTIFFGFSVMAVAQTSSSNPIITAIPYLAISPDARSGAMGNAGVALSPDANSIYWNASKLAFIENNSTFSLSYSPWLQSLSNDMNLAYASFVHKLDDRNTIGGSMHYFNMGSIDLSDSDANFLGTTQAGEFSFDGSFARKFGNNFSLGLTLRYIHSGIGTSAVEDQQSKSVNTMASDISMYFKNPSEQFGTDALFAFGASLSNIGPKINYDDRGQKYFLPTNLKVGAANTWFLNSQNQLTFALDLNKLVVPTPPIRNSEHKIISGKDDNRSVVSGIFGSFNDAPEGFKEELQEVSFSPALEYLYHKQFALRAGYCYEDPSKGNRQYLTMGAGLRYQIFDLDFSYLLARPDKSALANTLCFSLSFNFAKK